MSEPSPEELGLIATRTSDSFSSKYAWHVVLTRSVASQVQLEVLFLPVTEHDQRHEFFVEPARIEIRVEVFGSLTVGEKQDVPVANTSPVRGAPRDAPQDGYAPPTPWPNLLMSLTDCMPAPSCCADPGRALNGRRAC